MKDLVFEFSDVSERTLRGDINKLIDEGLIERLGGKSGPFSYFHAVSPMGHREQGIGSDEIDVESILLPEHTG